MKTTLRPLRSSIVALLGTAGLFLASCGTGGTGEAAAPSPEAGSSQSETQSTVTVTETAGDEHDQAIDIDFDSLQQVDPGMFREHSVQSLTYVVDGTTGECFVNAPLVTCIGTAADDVPDVDMPPLSGRPGAVAIGAAGVAYVIAEGVPPAKTELETGQWVNFGVVKCAKPDDSTLACVSDGAAFQIEGSDRDITTEGPILDPAELQASAEGQPGTGYTIGTDVLVQAPTLCGAMEGHRLADVVKGEITCKEAMEVLDEYDERMPSEGTGNAMIVDFDGWSCSSPTVARAEELQAKTVCGHEGRGIEVRAPL
ncbi:hypothetical protein [Corynebacterium freneyi]|uniref:hypothetical protein n=1 Tax=Corynebacterium freneyi TaxID=134034 RepID=UPI001EF3ADEB|nr:hypothetical protein [Corynebacterium freneyi]MCG7439818.1 hypothetical protein [Corynebacterium freneyi]